MRNPIWKSLWLFLSVGVTESAISAPLSCKPGFGPSLDGKRCVKKFVLPSRKSCPFPEVRFGHYDLQLGGRMAEFWCDDGRSIVPENASYAMCGAHGVWDRKPPRCVLTETGGCGELPEEDHLEAHNIQSAPGDSNTYYGFHCDPGYYLSGPTVLKCDGTLWNGTIPECKKIIPTTTAPSSPPPPTPPPIEEEAEIIPETLTGFKMPRVPEKESSAYTTSSATSLRISLFHACSILIIILLI